MPIPTDEQVQASDTFRAGHHLVLQAGAGTGKTTTLAMLAASTKRRGRYLAFNKDIARVAADRFPRTVMCKTAHATAYAALGHRYAGRLNGPRQPAWKTGQALGITRPIRIGDHEISHKTLSHTVLRAVKRFCYSADRALAQQHVPHLRRLTTRAEHAQLVDEVLPFAAKAWADLHMFDQGEVRFEHDHYLKMWALTQPKIEADFLFLDEAQDTNPVLEHVFNAQRDHAQLVMVGDSAQAIYGWRGARDVMTDFDAAALTLTRSFRFGPLLAEQANRWLELAQAPIRLTGSETIPTEVGDVANPDAVLCRTNIGAMAEVMRLLSEGSRVALARGGHTLASLALAARDLKEGRRTSHPELVLFASWGEVQDYATYDPAGGDLQPFVDLVDTHGPDAILAAVDELTDEDHADVTVSTAHKAKGREWATVRIGDDFPPPKDTDQQDAEGRPIPEPVNDTDARLAYVAVTRARCRLDLGGLSWIDTHPAASSATAIAELNPAHRSQQPPRTPSTTSCRA
ncbi:UvrD-helicase domain-containing protein [Streptomyces caniscabiei]|uniref:DNA 3'-5' helicase n=1 Tax=Streptomyces caniscabiei TaxID=2746961 RepID=A0ABU4MTR3_9ACTN|nr:UvrD-helicase domain-containing protein [Streptomyces caniscabiei]MBE4737637.1 ATP-dependent helicase [Streptomyces caniscabiei]MBE4756397.1 ATP-dependent helicase [Streptomyces caniscabiei]MBE4769587.1 ATP-dependent helicase [Streptomyces caniscabiei]MBE4787468.1 ATP-dependent helicase [Streptomyces caniscabiei]MBE4795127.1 ATP-dependent helicase [Streptomyces caniscabiei]